MALSRLREMPPMPKSLPKSPLVIPIVLAIFGKIPRVRNLSQKRHVFFEAHQSDLRGPPKTAVRCPLAGFIAMPGIADDWNFLSGSAHRSHALWKPDNHAKQNKGC